MKKCSIRYSIYVSELILCLGFTIICPFYSGIAIDKGIPLWLVGIIYALDPIAAIPSSFLISKHMKNLSRRLVLSLGIFLVGLSMGLLGTVEDLSPGNFLAVSIASRVLAGVGQGFAVLAGTAILTSQYPENLEEVIAYYESFGGIGLILGPVMGSLLASLSIFYSFGMLGICVIGMAGIMHFLIGEPKKYSEETSKVSFMELIFKPVRFTQVIFLDMIMQMIFPFCIGFIMPCIEVHLRDFNISTTFIGMCISLATIFYAIVSILGHGLMKKVGSRISMVTGVLLAGTSFLLIGPWEVLFERELYFVVIGQCLLGMSGALIQSKI